MPIGHRATALLLALLQNRNEILPKGTLMDAGWPGMAVEDSNLSVQIASLRRALNDGVESDALIQTVPRRGYRFVGAIEREISAPPPRDPDALPAPLEASRAKIAVLPFENIGGDPSQASFIDGLTRDLIGALAKQRSLFVIAANSSFHYRGSALDPMQITSDLGVRYLLEGSVQRAGSRIPVSARLLDGETGNHLWAERYDRDLIDILELQDEVAREIVGRTGSLLLLAERQRSLRKSPSTWQAYELFLNASDPSRRWHRETALALEAMAEKAIELDPEFAPAHALLARLLVNVWNVPVDRDRFLQPATLERAHQQAWTALSLDPCLADGYGILGWIRMWRGEIDLATGSFAKAFERNPNLVDYTYGQFLIIAGRVREGLHALERVTRYDPVNTPICQGMFGHAYFMLGEDQTALRFLRECTARAPDFWAGHVSLAATCARVGRVEEARRAVAEVQRIVPEFTISMWRAMHPYRDLEAAQSLFHWLSEAGLPA